MIKPYTAVGLIPTVRGIRKRADIKINLEHLEHLVKAASWLSSLDLPVGEETVRTHVHRIIAKLGVRRRTQAILVAMRLGMVGQVPSSV